MVGVFSALHFNWPFMVENLKSNIFFKVFLVQNISEILNIIFALHFTLEKTHSMSSPSNIFVKEPADSC